jgi:ADP-ribose pyrophosphatase YjhB (NUDIX family)
MSLPLKKSVAILVRNGDRFLSTRRSDTDDELPGVWGLPAGSYRGSETLEELVARIGRDKLAVTLTPIGRLAHGRQVRPQYILDMELWEAETSGEPRHPEWQWATADILEAGKFQGSLCCRLALETIKS